MVEIVRYDHGMAHPELRPSRIGLIAVGLHTLVALAVVSGLTTASGSGSDDYIRFVSWWGIVLIDFPSSVPAWLTACWLASMDMLVFVDPADLHQDTVAFLVTGASFSLWGGLQYYLVAVGLAIFYRRRRRLASGECPKCGYDLRGDLEDGCPECGWNRATSSKAVGEG